MDDTENEVPEPSEKYQLLLWMGAGTPEWRYSEEHWFVDFPERGEMRLLLDDAKQTFANLYDGREPTDFSIAVTRLRPADDFRPDFRRLIE